MSKKLDDALYQFTDDGADSKEKILNNILQKANSPVKSKIRYGKYATAAVSLCLIIVISTNFNVIADSINNIIRTLFPSETIMMNEINANSLQELIDARISETDDVPDKNSIEYQLVYDFEPAETPCYVYLFYYRGYLKAIVLDQRTKNIKEVEEWLKNNGGIVARAASTPEEAAQILDGNGSVSITPEKLRIAMGDGFMLPGYFPDGRRGGNVIQYDEDIGTVNITYFYEESVDFYPEQTGGITPNYISLGITNAAAEFGKNLTANLAVTKNIEMSKINGYDVYTSDGYYVWEHKGFVYVLYSTNISHEEMMKIIENMK